MSKMMNCPSLIQGNFNFILGNTNRLGGNPIKEKETMEFHDRVINSNMLELRIVKPRFT